jgi:hypothetical protein
MAADELDERDLGTEIKSNDQSGVVATVASERRK